MSDALSLPLDIDVCQYRRMPNSLVLLTPADPVRLRLMSLVASHQGGEACVCDLNDAFNLSQPTISHHMKVLHDAGLVDRDKRGVWVYYRTRPQALAAIGTLIGCTPAVTPRHPEGRNP
jgi:ArsR family transcriptional regulator, arsenate/arsenite/antimonite-responsive transcriptional repressor